MRRPRIGRLAAAFCGALMLLPAAAWAGPADQPPFAGGHTSQRMPPPSKTTTIPGGAHLNALEVSELAQEDEAVQAELGVSEAYSERVYWRDLDWEVVFRQKGEIVAIVVVDDGSGEVVDVFTDEQIDTKLARGYPGAVAGKANSWWIWIPLCVLFIAPFFDPRRPFRLLHLDLLVLLGLSVSLYFFNRGAIEASVVLVYPVLGYVFGRMFLLGFFGPYERDEVFGRRAEASPVPIATRSWLVAAIAALAIFHVGYQVAEGKVIDVGIASVIGADRLTDGEDIYGEEFGSELPSNGDVRGDVYGPVNYEAYAPFELVLPYEDRWDDVPAAQAAAVAFTLLTALALFALGRRLREGEEGTTLGVALAYAWLAYPFTLYTAASSFNDSLVALLIVCSLLMIASPPARGALAALAGLTKFGPLVLTPLLAAGRGERDWRSLALFAAAFVAFALAVTLPVLPDGGFKELYDRSLGYQASRGSPFSIWGQAPGLDLLHTASKVFAVAFGAALFFVPRTRTLAQLAALAAAALIAVQVTASHWLYPYAVWFVPLALAALFAVQRSGSLDSRTNE